MRYTFACVEVGFSFGDRSGFLVGIDLLEYGFQLGHAALGSGARLHLNMPAIANAPSHRFVIYCIQPTLCGGGSSEMVIVLETATWSS